MTERELYFFILGIVYTYLYRKFMSEVVLRKWELMRGTRFECDKHKMEARGDKDLVMAAKSLHYEQYPECGENHD